MAKKPTKKRLVDLANKYFKADCPKDIYKLPDDPDEYFKDQYRVEAAFKATCELFPKLGPLDWDNNEEIINMLDCVADDRSNDQSMGHLIEQIWYFLEINDYI